MFSFTSRVNYRLVYRTYCGLKCRLWMFDSTRSPTVSQVYSPGAFSGCDGVVVVFDVSDKESLEGKQESQHPALKNTNHQEMQLPTAGWRC